MSESGNHRLAMHLISEAPETINPADLHSLLIDDVAVSYFKEIPDIAAVIDGDDVTLGGCRMAFLLEIDDRLARILTELDQGGEIGTIALEELTVLAEAGDKSAIECLAFHLSGELLATDESIKWLLLANEFESADAAWQLAMIERQRSNLEEMKRWIDRSALLGQEDAIAVQKNGYDVQAVLATW